MTSFLSQLNYDPDTIYLESDGNPTTESDAIAPLLEMGLSVEQIATALSLSIEQVQQSRL